ncbi:hypothetical protein ABT341_00430 [Pseudonocardia alni]|uniref:hypothetical protein n=1 Tax=Pseudonocardia alni TaxID=33907 RepID=UPI003322B6D2
MGDRLSDDGTPWGSRVNLTAYALPDEMERAAIHAADQMARGYTDEAGFRESLEMLGIDVEAQAMADRHHTENARTARARHEKTAAVLELRAARRNRRRTA